MMREAALQVYEKVSGNKQETSALLTNCPLCASAHLQDHFTAVDPHYGISGSHRFVRCVACSLVFLNPMYSEQTLASLYPTDYYAYQDHFNTQPLKQVVKAILGYRNSTKDPHFASPGSFLDIGCGSGWFAQTMSQQGWNCWGVEISDAAARLGQSRGLRIFRGTLQEAKFESDFFDYVRSNHSFEHISSPHETLDEIYRILNRHGKLMIAVPNVDSFAARVFQEYWWHLAAPVHPFSYSVRTLSQLLSMHGFIVERVTFNSDYFGLVGSLQIWLNRNKQKKSMDGIVVNNQLLRFVSQWIVNMADLAHLGDMIEITAAKSK